MMSSKHDRILVAGIGNTLRGDDGIGAYVCNQVERLSLPGVTTIIAQQLDTAMLDAFVSNDHVLIVDAALMEEAVKFYRPGQCEKATYPASHHLSATVLTSLAASLYHCAPDVVICAVKGENFKLSSSLSSNALANAEKATALILDWIRSIKAGTCE